MSKSKKKVSSVMIPTSWLIAGALVLTTVVGAKAVYKASVEQAPVNEVRTSGATNSNNVQEGTYTGTVTREAAVITGREDKAHERYFLTTDSGAKYLLIGLKVPVDTTPRDPKPQMSPVGRPAKEPGAQIPEQAKGDRYYRTQTDTVPKPSPRADLEDVNTFEQYVGKRVTIIGMVVPVRSSDAPKASRPPTLPTTPKASNPGAGAPGRANKPMASAPVRTPKPDDGSRGLGSEYDRLVVRSITVVQ